MPQSLYNNNSKNTFCPYIMLITLIKYIYSTDFIIVLKGVRGVLAFVPFVSVVFGQCSFVLSHGILH